MQQAAIARPHSNSRRLWRALQQSEILAVTLLFAVLLALFLGPALFGDRVNQLFAQGFPDGQEPLAVLRELIALGEHEMEIQSA